MTQETRILIEQIEEMTFELERLRVLMTGFLNACPLSVKNLDSNDGRKQLFEAEYYLTCINELIELYHKQGHSFVKNYFNANTSQ